MKLDQAFGIHEQALKLRGYRSEVLASNLANADTPGYNARDMDFAQVLRGGQHKAPQLTATNARHITNGGPANA